MSRVYALKIGLLERQDAGLPDFVHGFPGGETVMRSLKILLRSAACRSALFLRKIQDQQARRMLGVRAKSFRGKQHVDVFSRHGRCRRALMVEQTFSKRTFLFLQHLHLFLDRAGDH